MKIIICGAGRTTDELLKRMGVSWKVTLIEKKESRLNLLTQRFPNIVRVMVEDASSPVVLEEAGLADQDCVLAMTGDDKINLAIAGFAKKAGIKSILTLVHDPEKISKFKELDVWTITMAKDAAHKAYRFLKDPRIQVTHLGDGDGELLELAVEHQDVPRLANITPTQDRDWQMVGVIRNNKLLFPDMSFTVREDDRLIILGRSNLYSTFSSRLAQSSLQFPKTYGQQMILGISDDDSLNVAELMNEAFYLAQGTHIEKIRIVCAKPIPDVQEAASRWSESLEIEIVSEGGGLNQQTTQLAGTIDAGIVIHPFMERSFMGNFLKNPWTKLAATLSCPLLLSRSKDPYENLLVPFDGSLGSQRALETAIDLAGQLSASVSVIIVVQPEFLKGDRSETKRWEQKMLKQVNELSRIHKFPVKELVHRGNPVREITSAAANFSLLVMDRQEKETGFFSLNITGMIIDRSPSSILLV